MLVAAAGLAVLAATTKVGGHYPGIVGGLFPMSIGMGVTFVSLTLVATTNVEESRRRPRLGDLQHLAADRRRARPRGPLQHRQLEDLRASSAGIVGKPTFLDQQEALVSGFQTAFIVAAALVAAGTVAGGAAAAPPRRRPDRVGRHRAVAV